jgi:hypothetical protein
LVALPIVIGGKEKKRIRLPKGYEILISDEGSHTGI